MESPGLRDLQASFFSFVAGTEAEAAGPGAALARAVVRGDDRLEGEARLRIYRGMCLARLVDVLREDYAAVAERLEPEVFDRLARDYVTSHPSVEPSIRHVSDRFPDFLAVHLPERPELAERAAVDRARLEVFAEVDPRPLRSSDLRALPADAWATFPLRPVAALRVVTRTWADDGRPRPRVVRLWRQGFEIFEATVDAFEALALDRLLAGSTNLEEMGACFAESLADEEAARESAALLLRWLEDGIVEAPPSGR